MALRAFGKLADGTTIDEVTLAAGDLGVSVLTWGAVIRDVRLAGVENPLVLGFDNIESYVAHSPYFGAVVGRNANRIGGGRFAIDGRDYQVTLNDGGRNHLHGGKNSFGKRPWRLISHRDDSATLAISSPDGDDGYPGNVEAEVTYTLEAPATIRVDIAATTDAPTLVNLAQHTYFNLDGSPDILDHVVQIFADAITPTDDTLIPTGEVRPVAGTDYDFREARPIRLMRDGKRVPYDLNWAVAKSQAATPRPLARLYSPKNGVTLAVDSTEPGVQFYDGNMMQVPAPGLDGRMYPANGGCCFEPQVWPDAPNHAGFPSSILRPGETYRQLTRFAFARN